MQMKKMIGAVALLGAFSGAMADDQLALSMTPVLGGGYQAGFTGVGSLLSGGSDVLKFSLPSGFTPGTYLVTVNVTGINVDFDFLLSNVNGISAGATNSVSLPGLLVDTGTFIGNTAPPFTLNLFGTAIAGGLFPSSYSGTISAALTAPVPEPESYAMFLAGLGILGAIARRRATRV